ncbi:MAG: DUF86 domain-containing protein [Asticcacaulis sp.]|uniref:HepT-like ribonuclease domain-containing protein n=1 Tax=Asticcacaulis sp. TaxID=1872648 RepID=UPI0025B80AED|nr:DUF86 domain-containing protein [Asticcacaulis sp.]MCA1936323.1 DUF86 domain-containing protein [Asticcacaulis sp.]
MRPDDPPARREDYIRHIQDAVTQALDYVEGMDHATFLSDRRTQQAVIMNLIIMGEAATRLMMESPDFIEHHPDIPWRNMRGMRNRLAHGYFDLDLDLIWETLCVSLPQLQRQISELS